MPTDERPKSGDRLHRCWHCGQPITDEDHVLVVSTSEGPKLALHAECFTETTFDPDQFTVDGLS